MTDYRELPADEKMEIDVDLEFIPPSLKNEIQEGTRCAYCLKEDCCCTCQD